MSVCDIGSSKFKLRQWGPGPHQGTAVTCFLPALLPVVEKGTEPEKPKQGSCLATHGPIAASPPLETSKRAVSSPNMYTPMGWRGGLWRAWLRSTGDDWRVSLRAVILSYT